MTNNWGSKRRFVVRVIFKRAQVGDRYVLGVVPGSTRASGCRDVEHILWPDKTNYRRRASQRAPGVLISRPG